MSIGWIKLHRKLLDSRVFANEGLLRVWIYCLCRANHEKNYVQITTGKGNTEVTVNPGEFIFGRNSVSRELNMNPSTLYKRILKLERIGNINIKSNSHYSVVSICNWATYQHDENEKEQPSNNQVTTRCQPGNTDKNVKNVKNDKKKLTDQKIVDVISDIDNIDDKNILLALHIWNDVNDLIPNNKTTLNAKVGNWSTPIRLMVERDDRTYKGIWSLWKRVQKDDFWSENILSTAKLRKQFDQLSIKLNKNGKADSKKIDTIVDSFYGE